MIWQPLQDPVAIFLQGRLEGPSPWDSIASSELRYCWCLGVLGTLMGTLPISAGALFTLLFLEGVPRTVGAPKLWTPGSLLTPLPMQTSEHPHLGMDLIL